MNIRENYLKNASRYISEQEETFPQQRVDNIVNEAVDAFFMKVAELCPEITTGDFDPLELDNFKKAADVAVRTWINDNIGDNDPVM